MTGLLLLCVIGLAAAVATLFRRLRSTEALVDQLHDRILRLDRGRRAEPQPRSPIDRPPIDRPLVDRPQAAAARAPATVTRTSAPAAVATEPTEPTDALVPDVEKPMVAFQPQPEQEQEPESEPVRLGFEAIVGGKLPIWIGGAALVLSAFFLVRFSIENDLLGPLARVILAASFGAIVIAASEAVRRLPATRDDPRIGQALAGTGIAIFYGTLYIAAARYDLIGDLPAFLLMVAVTLGALALALRHGPPTAIMALVGGFAAPLVAGFDSAGIGPLLAYLGLLVAALFGLAIRRGWVWLALAACGGGFAWVNLLIASIAVRDLPGVGGFVLLLAIGATLALPRTGAARPWLRLLPLLAGLIQLLVLAPALDFGVLAWGLYLLLSAATLWLGWRDATIERGSAAALILVLLLLGVALYQGADTAPSAGLIVTALFGLPGHLRGRRNALWATVALGGTAGPLLIAHAIAPSLLSDARWAGLLVLAAIACASITWRDRSNARAELHFAPAFTGGALLAALLLAVAGADLLPVPWLWPAWLTLGVALAGWSRRTGDRAVALVALLPAVCTALLVIADAAVLTRYGASVFGTAPRPPIDALVALGLLPPLLLAATAWLLPRGRGAVALGWIAHVLALALVPAMLPAPWHAAGLGLATTAAMLAGLPRAKLTVAALATLAAALPQIGSLLIVAALALGGDRLPYAGLPPLADVLRNLTLPAILVAIGLALRPAAFEARRAHVIAVLLGVAASTAYVLAKHPLAIATLPRFEAFGLLERALITQSLFAAGFALRVRASRVATVLFWLALARFVWFDLLLFNPLIVRQSVGNWPVANLATLHLVLVAAWLWPLRDDLRWRAAMRIIAALAVGTAVRQATHGTILTGGLGRTENWLYSAAFLALALAWLVRGIASAAADLRIAGLALLTLVTLKVFLVDASVLAGILRILSFLGLGIALIVIGWSYGRLTARAAATP